MIVGYYALRYLISIHALREESDLRTLCVDCPADRISIHALREESDNRHDSAAQAHILISIHALREESDGQHRAGMRGKNDFNPRPPRGERPGTSIPRSSCMIFQSTPSARRATVVRIDGDHAVLHFNPRPPRGERRPRGDPRGRRHPISIHALREESDPFG